MMEVNKKIIEMFSLDEMSPEDRDKYIVRITNLLNDYVVQESIIILNQEENKEFQELLEKSDKIEEISVFLRSKIKNFDELIIFCLQKIKKLVDSAKS